MSFKIAQRLPGEWTDRAAAGRECAATALDDGYVAALESLLRASGFDQVFNDVHAIRPDEQFWPTIERGIRGCDVVYVVITSRSLDSRWVQREVELARSLEKKIVPVWIEDCAVPATFADRDVVDFRLRGPVRSGELPPRASCGIRHGSCLVASRGLTN